MILFEVVDKKVSPTKEILLIYPFSEIWNRDNKTKVIAIKEFSYIEFMCSVKQTNPYFGYTKENRKVQLGKDIFNDPSYTPDTLIESAIEKYEHFLNEASFSMSYFLAAKQAAEKIKSFFQTFDINERNEKTNAPIYKPKDITSSIVDTDVVLQKLDMLHKKVEQEIFDTSKTRGNKEINYFEI